jgi:hypothetical protein
MIDNAAPRDLMQASVITFIAHAPERRRQRSGIPAQAGECCCCCCCCCLHSAGALIGAAIASAPSEGADQRIDQSTSGSLAVKIFWRTLLFLVLAVSGCSWFMSGEGLSTIIWVLIGLPGLQLAAAFLTSLILHFSGLPDESQQLEKLGKIVRGVVAGTAIGILVMLAILLLIPLFR